MAKLVSRSAYWVYPNIFGMGLYLYFASWVWAPSGEKSFPEGAGDPVIWGSTAGLVLALYSLVNLVWLALILSAGSRGKGWKPVLLWAVVILLWVAANRYDAYRHYDGTAAGLYSGTPSTIEKTENGATEE
ncbi:MAG: hypothetical protein EA357_00645 [Micavibrio sp.]|nr:MAG: hypothetical protein EA357_00645 [Micavibrio sp.]